MTCRCLHTGSSSPPRSAVGRSLRFAAAALLSWLRMPFVHMCSTLSALYWCVSAAGVCCSGPVPKPAVRSHVNELLRPRPPHVQLMAACGGKNRTWLIPPRICMLVSGTPQTR